MLVGVEGRDVNVVCGIWLPGLSRRSSRPGSWALGLEHKRFVQYDLGLWNMDFGFGTFEDMLIYHRFHMMFRGVAFRELRYCNGCIRISEQGLGDQKILDM